ncbi:o-succinylbenzoate synthase [Brochothrix campestris]|uniref:o-succinylbenzoate synthase n=1 Tax=Brochothrix campestris TaxID=2757 RepID=UPI0038D0034F
MKLKELEVYRMSMPLVESFSNSQMTVKTRVFDLVKLTTSTGMSGWGETVAFETPWYTTETLESCRYSIEHYLWPLIRGKDVASPKELVQLFSRVKGHQMAQAAIETAFWGIYSQDKKVPLNRMIGSVNDEVAVGVSLGLDTAENLLRKVAEVVDKGYTRVKIKIKPGQDIETIRLIREKFPDLKLMVDANGAYSMADAELLARLDDYHLEMIEQPLGDDDFINHATLQKQLQTKICLDENIHSLEDVKVAFALGSARAINLKWGRVGGITKALEIIAYCQAHNLEVWCGGMFESGVGRAYNLALASLSGMEFPGDISESSRYWREDIVKQPQKLHQGKLTVSEGVGAGFEIDSQAVQKYCLKKERFI